MNQGDGAAPISTSAAGRRLRLLVPVAAGGLFLGLVLWLADLDDLIERIAHMSPRPLGWAAAAYFGTYLAKARRFAAAGARARTTTLLFIVMVHGALNRVMPLRTGELAYPVLAKRTGAAQLGEGFVQLFLLRLLDLATVVILFLLALGATMVGSPAAVAGPNWSLTAGAVALGFVCLTALWHLETLLRWPLRLARRLLTRLVPGSLSKLDKILTAADEATRSVTLLSGGQRFRLAWWSLFCWGSYFVLFYFILQAVGEPLPFGQTVLGSSAAIVASVIPLSGLGTFGALEGGWTGGFVAVGVDGATAATTALAMSGLTLAFALVLGLVGWLALSLGNTASPQRAREGRLAATERSEEKKDAP